MVSRNLYTICIFLSFLFFISSNIYPESKSKKKKYLKNLIRVEEFKHQMSQNEREYYEPRKRFIDKQSVSPTDDFFYQIDIILRGTVLREKNRWNIREIRKLEKFLIKADDFQLNRYFGQNEELYLSLPATQSIQSIKKEAAQDENWRIKNDPYFIHYLKHKATKEEKKFYSQNKALFYKKETGIELVKFLQSQVGSTRRSK